MTTEQCNRCRFAPTPGSYSTCSGDDLPVWSCDKIDDPEMPFDMDEDTVCPCFKPREEQHVIEDEVCIFCGADTCVIDIGVDDREWIDENTVELWQNYHCTKCGKDFVGRIILKVVERILGEDDKIVLEKAWGE